MELSLWLVTLSPGVWLLQRTTTILYTVDSASFYLSLHLARLTFSHLYVLELHSSPPQPLRSSQRTHCIAGSEALLCF